MDSPSLPSHFCWLISTKSAACGILILMAMTFYGLSHMYEFQSSEMRLQTRTIVVTQNTCIGNGSEPLPNPRITFDRGAECNVNENRTCYSTNKSLVLTFWSAASVDKWVAQNIVTAFPTHSFDHMIFVHDNSTWHTHAGYDQFMWIHVQGQRRLWYVKRFALPSMVQTYQYVWLLDDDAELLFDPLHYQCVVKSLGIPLSAPGRLAGALSHDITRVNDEYKAQMGRWTDFVETGPLAVASSAAWQCILQYLDPSTGSGWGLDSVWCRMLAGLCFPEADRFKVCGIVDAFGVNHQSATINSGFYGVPELSVYQKYYTDWSSADHIYGPLALNDSLMTLCRA